MVNEIFPKKTNDELSDRDYETDCILTWCCNSLNALEGAYSRRKEDPLMILDVYQRKEKTMGAAIFDSGSFFFVIFLSPIIEIV